MAVNTVPVGYLNLLSSTKEYAIHTLVIVSHLLNSTHIISLDKRLWFIEVVERLAIAVPHNIRLPCLIDRVVHGACKSKGALDPSTAVTLMKHLIVRVVELTSDHAAERRQIIAFRRHPFSFRQSLLPLKLLSGVVRIDLMSLAEWPPFIDGA